MLANALTVPIGLWLAYSAIFAMAPAGTSNTNLAVCGTVIVALAMLARVRNGLAWQSVTNVVLGALLVLYAAARQFLGDFGFGPFWIGLLAGTMAAIAALWSILYRQSGAPAGTVAMQTGSHQSGVEDTAKKSLA